MGVFVTRDAALVNSFANDPDILPFCGFPEATASVDVSNRIGDLDIAFVTDGDGAMICFDKSSGRWEFHSMFRRACRGRKALDAAAAMFAWLAREVGDVTLWGTCPVDNRGVRWFCRQLGMTSHGVTPDPHFGQVELFSKVVPCR